jgi:hypothetical protein
MQVAAPQALCFLLVGSPSGSASTGRLVCTYCGRPERAEAVAGSRKAPVGRWFRSKWVCVGAMVQWGEWAR